MNICIQFARDIIICSKTFFSNIKKVFFKFSIIVFRKHIVCVKLKSALRSAVCRLKCYHSLHCQICMQKVND